MIQALRISVGLAAIACIVVALNLVTVLQEPYTPAVMIPAVLGVVLTLLWALLSVTGFAASGLREARSAQGLNAALACVAVLGICTVIYSFAIRSTWALDLTRDGRRELAPQTVQILQNLNEPVEILCFFPRSDEFSTDDTALGMRNTRRFLERTQRESPWIQVEYLDPETEIRRLQELNLTRLSRHGTIVFKVGARNRPIHLEQVNPRLRERDFTNALINLLRESEPAIYFLRGHNERAIDDPDEQHGLTAFASLLQSQAYRVDSLLIDYNEPEIPADCSLLAIIAPEGDLMPGEVAAIQEYMERGGRLFVLMDPWYRLSAEVRARELFRPWLRQYLGIEIGNDLVVSPVSREQLILGADVQGFDDLEESDFFGSYNYGHMITRGMRDRMVIRLARSVGLADVRPEDVNRNILLRTTPDAWGETEFGTSESTVAVFNELVDLPGPVPLAVAATRNTGRPLGDTGQTVTARALVMGNSSFVTNGELLYSAANMDFALNCINWLTDTEDLVAVRPRDDVQQPIVLEDRERRLIAWLASLGSVQVVALAGAIAYAVRRKYR